MLRRGDYSSGDRARTIDVVKPINILTGEFGNLPLPSFVVMHARNHSTDPSLRRSLKITGESSVTTNQEQRFTSSKITRW